MSAEFRIFDKLFTEKNPSQLDNFTEALNKDSLIVYKGFVENSIKAENKEQTFQFERKGYFIQDSCDSSEENLIFNQVVSLRETNK